MNTKTIAAYRVQSMLDGSVSFFSSKSKVLVEAFLSAEKIEIIPLYKEDNGDKAIAWNVVHIDKTHVGVFADGDKLLSLYDSNKFVKFPLFLGV